MDAGSPKLISRRQVVGGGMLLGVAYLAGCSGTPRAGGEPIPGPITQGTPKPLPLPPMQPMPVTPANGAYQMMPRSAWTSAGIARPRNVDDMNGVKRITIHHDGMTAFTSASQTDAARRLESIRVAHLGRVSKKGEPWADIGYHYAIDPAGRVWDARPIEKQGAHVEDQNEHNLGIVMLGNYERQTPSRAQTAALDAFVVAQMRTYRVPISRVFTHQEIGRTACPGTSLQRYMVATRASSGALRLTAAREVPGLA